MEFEIKICDKETYRLLNTASFLTKIVDIMASFNLTIVENDNDLKIILNKAGSYIIKNKETIIAIFHPLGD